jgi:DNA-binding MarR family transcriptional regulator
MSNYLSAARAMTADCLCFRVRRTSRVLTRIYEDALRPLGIHATQLTLLNAIAMVSSGGGGTRQLAEVLAMDATTLSRNLRPLVGDGLVELSMLPGRRRVVRLSRRGEQLLEQALPRWEAAHARVLEALGAEDAIDLRDRLDATAAAGLTAARVA